MQETTMTKLEQHLLTLKPEDYTAYYNGKMSYRLRGKSWRKYVDEELTEVEGQTTSENIFKDAIDLYASNLIPDQEELRGFSNSIVPLLTRGEALVLVDPAGEAHFPEHFTMISDGRYTVAAIFTRSLATMQDYITFATSDGVTRLFQKKVPDDLKPSTLTDGFTFVEEQHGNTLIRLALDDKGFGANLAALQDRVNHSIIDQTVIAEMYVRPFWYLLNYEKPPVNPYLPNQQPAKVLDEETTGGGSGRVFVTSGEGPFGQLEPPTIGDMVAYHDSLIAKVSQSTGIPEFYFKPGTAGVPSGTALKTLSKRFNQKIARLRDDIKPKLLELAMLLGIQPEPGQDEVVLWAQSDDLLQESLDAHGLALTTMGYPLDYVAEVVTPGVNLDNYLDDGFGDITPDQIAAYVANPGQRKGEPAVAPDHSSMSEQVA